MLCVITHLWRWLQIANALFSILNDFNEITISVVVWADFPLGTAMNFPSSYRMSQKKFFLDRIRYLCFMRWKKASKTSPQIGLSDALKTSLHGLNVQHFKRFECTKFWIWPLKVSIKLCQRRDTCQKGTHLHGQNARKGLNCSFKERKIFRDTLYAGQRGGVYISTIYYIP